MDVNNTLDIIMEDDSDISDFNESCDEEDDTVVGDAESVSDMYVSDSSSDVYPGAVQVSTTPITQPGPSQLRAMRRNYLW